MVKLSLNGLVFDEPVTHEISHITKYQNIEINSKSILLTIDYSTNHLHRNKKHVLNITNNMCNKSVIIANILSNHTQVFMNSHNIIDGAFSLTIHNAGKIVNDIVQIRLLLLT
jgi:hypothetical protein